MEDESPSTQNRTLYNHLRNSAFTRVEQNQILKDSLEDVKRIENLKKDSPLLSFNKIRTEIDKFQNTEKKKKLDIKHNSVLAKFLVKKINQDRVSSSDVKSQVKTKEKISKLKGVYGEKENGIFTTQIPGTVSKTLLLTKSSSPLNFSERKAGSLSFQSKTNHFSKPSKICEILDKNVNIPKEASNTDNKQDNIHESSLAKESVRQFKSFKNQVYDASVKGKIRNTSASTSDGTINRVLKSSIALSSNYTSTQVNITRETSRFSSSTGIMGFCNPLLSLRGSNSMRNINTFNPHYLSPIACKMNNLKELNSSNESKIPSYLKARLEIDISKNHSKKMKISKFIEKKMKIFSSSAGKSVKEVFFRGKRSINVASPVKISSFGESAETGNTEYNFFDCKDLKETIGSHIGFRYEVLDWPRPSDTLKEGECTYLFCFDHKSNKEVEVKLINKNNLSEFEREIEFYEFLKEEQKSSGSWVSSVAKSNFIEVIEVKRIKKFTVIVTESVSESRIPLKEHIVRFEKRGLYDKSLRAVCKQLLFSLYFLKTKGFLLNNLSMENIWVKKTDDVIDIKIANFNRTNQENGEKLFFKGDFHTAPEIILGANYSYPADIWSLGTIMAELSTGKTIFPGEDDAEILNIIRSFLGCPSNDYLKSCKFKRQFFTVNNIFYRGFTNNGRSHYPNSKTLESFLSRQSNDLIDFVKKLLVIDPDKRITIEETLEHQWVTFSD